MKIVGKTQYGYMAELDESELANILGISSRHNSDFNKAAEKLGAKKYHGIDWVGINVPISSMYEGARFALEGINMKSSFQSAIHSLDNIKRVLESVREAYHLTDPEEKDNE